MLEGQTLTTKQSGNYCVTLWVLDMTEEGARIDWEEILCYTQL